MTSSTGQIKPLMHFEGMTRQGCGHVNTQP